MVSKNKAKRLAQERRLAREAGEAQAQPTPKSHTPQQRSSKQPQKTEQLTHDEIWDDTSLIESWDAVFAEYQYYHSLHARGEDVEAVLDAAEEEEEKNGEDADVDAEEGEEAEGGVPGYADAEAEEAEGGRSSAKRQKRTHDVDGAGELEEGEDVAMADGGTMPAAPPLMMPEGMIGRAGHDEAMKSLMMSWYWAGYYTGVYEGETRAAAAPAAAGGAGAAATTAVAETNGGEGEEAGVKAEG